MKGRRVAGTPAAFLLHEPTLKTLSNQIYSHSSLLHILYTSFNRINCQLDFSFHAYLGRSVVVLVVVGGRACGGRACGRWSCLWSVVVLVVVGGRWSGDFWKHHGCARVPACSTAAHGSSLLRVLKTSSLAALWIHHQQAMLQ